MKKPQNFVQLTKKAGILAKSVKPVTEGYSEILADILFFYKQNII